MKGVPADLGDNPTILQDCVDVANREAVASVAELEERPSRREFGERAEWLPEEGEDPNFPVSDRLRRLWFSPSAAGCSPRLSL